MDEIEESIELLSKNNNKKWKKNYIEKKEEIEQQTINMINIDSWND